MLGGIKIRYIILLIYLLLNLSQKDIQNITFVSNNINVFKEIEPVKVEKVFASFHGPMTGYGPDCLGCSGITASGYNVVNNIYYYDNEYGKVRIIAADKTLPFGTIIRIKDLDIFKDDILAIVLDRGSAIGFNKNSYFDLLYKSEKDTNYFGRRYATFEVLRYGY